MKTLLTLTASTLILGFATSAKAETVVLDNSADAEVTTTTTVTTAETPPVIVTSEPKVVTTPTVIPSQTVTVGETVTTTTTPAITTLTMAELDANNDMMLSMEEVGEKLFFIFDQDGNEVIDNIEFENNAVLTMRPVDVQKYTYVDINNDGTIESSSYTYEMMYEQSGLIQFDDNADGLSPADFLETSFLETDDNKDKTIDLQEFQEVYIASRAPKSAEQERYQN